MLRYIVFALSAFIIGGCGIFVQDGPWDLSVGVGIAGQPLASDVAILFPDAPSLGNCADLELWALEIQGIKCQDLVDGYLGPDSGLNLGHMSTTLPVPQGALIRGLPDRQAMFFAQARDSEGRVLLRACTTARARKRQGISLDMQCVCEPVPGVCAAQDEKAGNEIDDDCDGLTDECTNVEDCDDGNGCTQDICVEGVCQNSRLPDGLQCSDLDPCTLGDTCLAGDCQGESKDCSAYDGSCLVGTCNEETGACESLPAQDGTNCDDGKDCTEGDTCVQGICQGQEMDCSDDDEICTLDSCDEQRGCTHTLVARPGMEGPVGDASCANGKDDDCDGKTDGQDPNCLPCTQDSDCNDENDCTQDRCSNNKCSNLPIQGYCDDGVFCNGDDSCKDGACQVHSGDPCAENVGDDDDDCSESCDEDHDSCTASDPDGTHCVDGNFCTDNEQCHSGVCDGGIAHDCSDGDICTIDTCDEDGDKCDHSPDPNPGTEGPIGDATCSNGLDDDCDGETDSHDYDCFECSATEGSYGDPACSNTIDDDCDGATDGSDDNCWPASQCGRGTAEYSITNEYVTDEAPKDIVAADFNNDQKIDLAICYGTLNKINLFLGNNDGTVQEPLSSAVGDFPYSMKAADFDSDGNMDLVTANYNSNNISILLGNGDGTFSFHRDYYSGPLHDTDSGDHPRRVIVSDFDGNSVPDLAVANTTSDTIGILLGQGNGTFSDVAVIQLSDYQDGDEVDPSDLLAVDMNKDGVMDLAFISYFTANVSGHVTILLGGNAGGHWDGTFSEGQDFTIDRSTYSMVSADFNNDGIADFAVTHTFDEVEHPDVTIMLGQGSGTWNGNFNILTFYHHSGADRPHYILAGHLDSDCMVDLAVSSTLNNRVRIYHGNGDGSFDQVYAHNPIIDSAGALTMADFNGDGANDLAVVGDDFSGEDHLKIALGDMQERTLPKTNTQKEDQTRPKSFEVLK